MAEKMVKIKIPKDRSSKNKTRVYGVNGRLMAIPLGEWVEVPESYAEVVQSCMDAEDELDIFIEKVQKASRRKPVED